MLPLLVSVLPLIAQRNEPLGSYTWTTHLLPNRLLILFASLHLLRVSCRCGRESSFLFLLLVFVAAHDAVLAS